MEEDLKKISELEPVSDLYEGCCIPLVQNDETRKVTYQVLKEKLNEDLDFVKNTDDLEERMEELEDKEDEQNEHIRDLINGYRSKVDKSKLDETNARVTKLENIVPKKTTTGTNSLKYYSKEYDLFGGEYGGNIYQNSTTGKNLFNVNNYVLSDNRGSITINEDDSFILTSSLTGTYINTRFFIGEVTSNNMTIDFEVENISGDNDLSWYIRYTDTPTYDSSYPIINQYNNKHVVLDTSDKIGKYLWIHLRNNIGSTTQAYSKKFKNFMVVNGNYTTQSIKPYEPYTGGQPSPNLDYPQEITTINSVSIKRTNEDGTIEETTPINLQNNELASLPNGVKDELVIENGNVKIIKRVGKINSYNGETITGYYISTTGQLTNGATVYYELATPQTIDLGEVEMPSTFEGENNVKILATLEPTFMSETHVRNLEKELDELSNALISLGGNI